MEKDGTCEVDRIRNEALLERVGEERMLLKLIKKRKRNWLGHWLRRNCVLKDALEGVLEKRSGTVNQDGLTHNQIDHILIDKRRHTSIVDIRTFRGADCNSDHYLVIGELRERLSVAKRVEQQVNITKFNILKLKDEEAKQNYQVEISNRFATLESSDEVEKELDVNSVWENIRDSIKIAAEQSIGYYETKKKKPWFDEDCCMVVERRKQAKLKF
ncbi:hypothetical protein ANN_11349 [Periplaneta americana]|uniref:Uncharacterized protein n=1 Tax=Periplaneta americana TaxID=6978 RepID=A0ABQ8T4R3_PERAM|nr:hypothetical protein ANN_11349 [Periplaneta americana]